MIRLVGAHDEAHDEIQSNDPVFESLTETEQQILEACAEAAQRPSDLMEKLGHASRTGSFKRAISRLMEIGLLERTLPDVPRSKKQQYRLTDKGKRLIQKS